MLTTTRRVLKWLLGNPWISLASRLSLGSLFVVSSSSKLSAQSVFTTKVLSYGMLPDSLARPFAAVLPFVELFAGCCLILGVFIRLTSALSIAMSLSFTVANLYAIFRHVGAFYCGCLGNLVNFSHPAALAIDFAMILVACLLWVQPKGAHFIGIRALLDKTRAPLKGSQSLVLQVALVALAMVTVIGAIGTRPNEVDKEIRAALGDHKVVLVFVYQGDPAESLQQRAILSEIEVQYSQEVSVVRNAAGSDRRVDALFPADYPATLFIIAGQDSNGYLVSFQFDGVFDHEAIASAIVQTIDRLASRQDH